jgi:hypothetical protein
MLICKFNEKQNKTIIKLKFTVFSEFIKIKINKTNSHSFYQIKRGGS